MVEQDQREWILWLSATTSASASASSSSSSRSRNVAAVAVQAVAGVDRVGECGRAA
jgi:hypothetical protein